MYFFPSDKISFQEKYIFLHKLADNKTSPETRT